MSVLSVTILTIMVMELNKALEKKTSLWMGYGVVDGTAGAGKRKCTREVEAGDNRGDVRKKEVRASSGSGPMFEFSFCFFFI